MCAKNHLLIFSSFLDIWENVEWPRFFGPPGKFVWSSNDVRMVIELIYTSVKIRISNFYTSPKQISGSFDFFNFLVLLFLVWFWFLAVGP